MRQHKAQVFIPAVHRYSSGFLRPICVWHVATPAKPYRFKYTTHSSYGFVGKDIRRAGTHVRDIPFAFAHPVKLITMTPASIEALNGLVFSS